MITFSKKEAFILCYCPKKEKDFHCCFEIMAYLLSTGSLSHYRCSKMQWTNFPSLMGQFFDIQLSRASPERKDFDCLFIADEIIIKGGHYS
jgi:hypothetical protein